MSKQFTRRKEDFTCGYCGFKVHGSGYTNHCPKCLWSKHVDVNPGDREEPCRGLMEPVAVEGENSEFVIVHGCIRCGVKRRNGVSPDDGRERLSALPGYHSVAKR